MGTLETPYKCGQRERIAIVERVTTPQAEAEFSIRCRGKCNRACLYLTDSYWRTYTLPGPNYASVIPYGRSAAYLARPSASLSRSMSSAKLRFPPESHRTNQAMEFPYQVPRLVLARCSRISHANRLTSTNHGSRVRYRGTLSRFGARPPFSNNSTRSMIRLRGNRILR